MSVTVHSVIVNPDALIPRADQIQESEMEMLTPWVFEHFDVADRDCPHIWPRERGAFKDFFWYLSSYYTELNDFSEKGIACAKNEYETITLPKRNWTVPGRADYAHLMGLQGTMLRILMETIHLETIHLEKSRKGGHQLYFPMTKFKQAYVIGGDKYYSRPDGTATFGPPEKRVPILSFAGWYEGQTWKEFLTEILSIMLGQVARNVNVCYEDQEVFIIGFYERCIYIARGFFTKDLISRVHLKGCSEDETIELLLTRGYNLSLREEWMEAVGVLANLLRYLLSGNAKVGALQAHLPKAANFTAG
ncbi:hypothetical protein BDW42DRAFT_161934 [Aspergillus taichungensis]|uniref:Uncharacterized protein n=1 Tax=Aspergillus taichungensis TaxID=482145 RepID=A0A2J5I4T7_9EURO|nr:hypothetical protein BDW42DRAFT_161934 [Aspergillus taichungensis]